MYLHLPKEDNAELKQIELESINTAPRVESNSKVTELPILQEDENSISLETAGGLRLADDLTPYSLRKWMSISSNLEPVVVAVDEKDIVVSHSFCYLEQRGWLFRILAGCQYGERNHSQSRVIFYPNEGVSLMQQ